MIVKISMPTGRQIQARVTTQDGTLTWKVPADQVGRRLEDKNTKVAFFSATLEEKSGILELGDRVADENW